VRRAVGEEGGSGECRKGESRICPWLGGYNSLVEQETWLLNQVFLFCIKITQILANGCGGRDGCIVHNRESPRWRKVSVREEEERKCC
jgi:hypothetical protein